jgi:predicted nucleic acid-binding protein
MRILLDTNIIVHVLRLPDPEHQESVEALAELTQRGWDLCVGNQNIFEFWVVATRPQAVNGMGLSPAAALQEVDVLLATYSVLPDPPDLRDRWLSIRSRQAVSGRAAHDARLVALMQAHGVGHLLTYNTADFGRYRGLTVLNPSEV